MAQLDLTTFMPQLFWFLIIFVGFYTLAFNVFVPKIAIMLKTRNKSIDFFNKELSTTELNVEKSEKFIFNTLQTYKNFLIKIDNQSSENFDKLKKTLLVNYQNYFFGDSIYTNYIYAKTDINNIN